MKRTRRVAAETRQQILEAALDLFANQGFKMTPVQQIALACGLTPGALYKHFSSKEMLLYKLVEEGHSVLDRALDEAERSSAGKETSERLKALLKAFALFHTDFADLARVADREAEYLGDTYRQKVIRLRRQVLYQFEGLIQEGISNGTFALLGQSPKEERITTMGILNMGLRIAYWFDPEGDLDAETVAAIHADLALRMLTGPGWSTLEQEGKNGQNPARF